LAEGLAVAPCCCGAGAEGQVLVVSVPMVAMVKMRANFELLPEPP
jgi:hypothetical protein